MKFNYPLIFRLLTKILMLLGAFMILPLIIALISSDMVSVKAFIASICTTFVLAGLSFKMGENHKGPLQIRDGFFAIVFIWILSSFLGALPFFLAGQLSLVNAFFEATSGTTTSGASIIKSIGYIPSSLLVWRSLLSWLGGLAFILFSTTILPSLNIGAHNLPKREIKAISTERLKGRSLEILKTYCILTLLLTFLLKLSGAELFHSFIHALGTISTGGFSSYDNNVAGFGSSGPIIIIGIFMIFSGLNLELIFLTIRYRKPDLITDSETRFFVLTLLMCAALTAIILSDSHPLLVSFFHVASMASTTGYYIGAYSGLTTFTWFMFFALMLLGASSGSAGGGLKSVRVLILLKFIRRGTITRLHPNAICNVRLGGYSVPGEVVTAVAAFSLVYIVTIAFGGLIISCSVGDISSAFAASTAFVSNTGHIFTLTGSGLAYDGFPSWLKIFSALLMITGRLEMFSLLMFFNPKFWRGM